MARTGQRMRRWAAVTAVLVGLSSSTPSWGQILGQLTQLPGLDGCIADVGGATCTDGRALNGLGGGNSVAISPDGKHVYVVSIGNPAVAVLRRNKSTGALTQALTLDGCVSETGNNGCSDGSALVDPAGVAVSPDGKHVYVASFASNAVAAFTRTKSTGALTQLAGLAGCISETGSAGACTDGKGLFEAVGVTVSPDGKHVYVASYSGNAVAAFARDKTTGALTQLAGLAGCISETGSAGACADGHALLDPISVAVSKDGKHVYVASFSSNAVAAFARDTTTGVLIQLSGVAGCTSEDDSGGTCADGKALDGSAAVTVSPDGKHVYVASAISDAVAVFTRNTSTGELTQSGSTAGCVSASGSGGTCVSGTGLDGASAVVVSKDGKHVYVASSMSGAVAAFARDKGMGVVTQLADPADCTSETGSGGTCADGKALDGARALAISKDGKHVYVRGAVVAVFTREK